MELTKRIESASLKQLAIAAGILAAIILIWINRDMILSKIKSDVP